MKQLSIAIPPQWLDFHTRFEILIWQEMIWRIAEWEPSGKLEMEIARARLIAVDLEKAHRIDTQISLTRLVGVFFEYDLDFQGLGLRAFCLIPPNHAQRHGIAWLVGLDGLGEISWIEIPDRFPIDRSDQIAFLQASLVCGSSFNHFTYQYSARNALG